MSKKPLLKFFLVLSLLTVVLYVAYAFLVNSGLVPQATYDLEIFLTQYIVMLLIYFLLLRALSASEFFVQAAIFATVAKLVIYGIFNFVIISLSPEAAPSNVILFLVIYLIFTPLAVGMLYPVINLRQKERHKPH